MWIAVALATAMLTPSANSAADLTTNDPIPAQAEVFETPPAVAGADRAVCQAPPAAPGQAVHGPVLHIPSEGQLCIATGYDPSQWIPIPLAVTAISRGALMSAAFGQDADCVIQPDGAGRCTIAGRPLDARLRATPQRISNQWR